MQDKAGSQWLASASFSSSFVTSCRFWLAANSIWATLVVAACVTVAMRLRMVDGWPFIFFFIFLSTGLVIRELWKSKLRVKTLLILLLGLASTGFPLWPCLIKGSFISVAGDTFGYAAFGQYLVDHHRGLEFGLSPIDQFGATLSETHFGTASILSFLSVLFHSTTAEAVLQSRISVAASASFSSSFVTSCRFLLAANSIWATLIVAACIPVAMRLRMVNGWPFIAFFIFLSAGLVIRELWKSKLRVKTLLILILGLAGAGFLLWPCLIGGAFVSVAGDPFFYSCFRSIRRRSSPGIRSWFVANRSIWSRSVGNPVWYRFCS